MSNKYKHLNEVQAEFDFHNRGPLRHEVILNLADDFINECMENNFNTISFIVGQGIHSPKGQVIKPMIADFLKNHPAVKSFSEGKFTQGGSGVFIVKLK
jgi:DNA-nicking Smr family endonuclease